MNLNLLPSKAKFQAAKIKTRQMVWKINLGILTVWSFALVVALGMNLYINYLVDAADKQLIKHEKTFSSLSENIVTSQILKYRAKIVGGVIKNRFEYGKAFELIQGLFPPEVVLKSNNLRENNVFAIEGVMSEKNNMDMIENIVKEINMGKRDRLISSTLTGLTLKSGEWNFTMEVAIK